MVRHGWKVTGSRLVRELLMRDLDEAMAERVAQEAEDHLRRPTRSSGDLA